MKKVKVFEGKGSIASSQITVQMVEILREQHTRDLCNYLRGKQIYDDYIDYIEQRFKNFSCSATGTERKVEGARGIAPAMNEIL